MANTVIALKKSATPSAAPTNLANGELAINFADGKLFYKAANGTISSINGNEPNYFGTVNANNTLVIADTPGDIFTIAAGKNIDIVGDAVNDRLTVSLTNDVTITGNFFVNNSTGLGGSDEGGELKLANATSAISVLNGPIVVDIYQNKIRFFENGSPNRGAFINLAAASASVGTDLLAAATSTDSLARATASQAFDKANAALPNISGAWFNGTLSTSADFVADKIISTNNGNAENFKVGDDAWIGDFNTVNSIRIKGQQNPTDGYISFGTGDTKLLGRSGTGPLTYDGSTIWHAGNDGISSGLDADLLDGQHGSYYGIASDVTAAFASANAGFAKANTANITADRAWNHANAAFITANIAFANANTVMVSTQAAFTVANSGFIHANSGYAFANSISITANLAFAHANAAFANGNTVIQTAQSAFTQANLAFIHANNAFASANAGQSTANAAFNRANTANITADRAWNHANAAFASANIAFANANTVMISAQAAFTVANSGFIHANSGYAFANSIALTANAAFLHANAVFANANTIMVSAQAAFTVANSSFLHSNAAYAFANSITITANLAFAHANAGQSTANAAFNKANNALPLTGGTVTGSIILNDPQYVLDTGNPGRASVGYIENISYGITTPNTNVQLSLYHPSGSFLLVGQSGVGISSPLGSGISVTSNLSPAAGLQINPVVISTSNKDWYFSGNGHILFPDSTKQYTAFSNSYIVTINAAFAHANLAFAHANSAYANGNTVIQTAQSAFNQANLAFIHANNAFASANAGQASGNAAQSTANAAFNRANTANITADRAWNHANAAFASANIAFANANTVMVSAQAAFTVANSGFIHANAGYAFANSIAIIANLAFVHANAAFDVANTSGVEAEYAFLRANLAHAHANAAFANANTVMISAQAAFTVANSGFLHANSGYAFANSIAITANLAFAHANSAYANGNVVIQTAQSAFTQANLAFIHANNAFASANAGQASANAGMAIANGAFASANAGQATANAAFNKANTANITADRAWNHANAAFDVANTSGVEAEYAFLRANLAHAHANASYVFANSAHAIANLAFTHANNAYAHANAAFLSSNGVNTYTNSTYVKLTASSQTITGDVNIVGVLTLSGNTVFIDATRLEIDDPLIYLAGNNYTSDIVDIGFIANYVNATGQNVHTGLYREHENKEYYLFQGYDKEPANNHIGALSNNMTLAVLNADIRTSNLILGGTNTIPWITASFNHANAAHATANASITHANQAFAKANTANLTADLAFNKANSALPNTSGVSFNGNLFFPAGSNVGIGTTSSFGYALRVLGETSLTSSTGYALRVSGESYLDDHITGATSNNWVQSFFGSHIFAFNSKFKNIGGTGWTRGATGNASAISAENVGIYFFTSANGTAGESINSSANKRMLIDYSGNVSIGRGTALPEYKLDVQGTVNASNILVNQNMVWHSGNDGTGSNLDADFLDGQHGSYYGIAADVTAAFLRANTANITADRAWNHANAAFAVANSALPSASYTAADVLAKLITVDGAGTNLDADLLDGQQGSYYGISTDVSAANRVANAAFLHANAAFATANADYAFSNSAHSIANLAFTHANAAFLSANAARTVVNDSINATRYLMFANGTSGTASLNVAIGLSFNPSSNTLNINGPLNAITKSFLISHPTKDGMKLRYGSLEGPENGVYVRGRVQGPYIYLPDYWLGLVDRDSITVSLTPIAKTEMPSVLSWNNEKVVLHSDSPIDCFYYIIAERKDVDKLVVEF